MANGDGGQIMEVMKIARASNFEIIIIIIFRDK